LIGYNPTRASLARAGIDLQQLIEESAVTVAMPSRAARPAPAGRIT